MKHNLVAPSLIIASFFFSALAFAHGGGLSAVVKAEAVNYNISYNSCEEAQSHLEELLDDTRAFAILQIPALCKKQNPKLTFARLARKDSEDVVSGTVVTDCVKQEGGIATFAQTITATYYALCLDPNASEGSPR
jgi:hypothetical protein